ncbi:hypothetical protein SOVF_143370 [Spinacia oleracea]|nr:hypothetical protein SOVF_143370 [Spinacia oleracea]
MEMKLIMGCINCKAIMESNPIIWHHAVRIASSPDLALAWVCLD